MHFFIGHINDRLGKARKATVNTPENRRKIISYVKRNPRISMRKISRDINVDHETIGNVAKINLGLKPLKQHVR